MASPLARKLRRTPTDAEIRLWSRLRRKQLEGFRFRRQHPLGPYVVDFFCAAAKLIVEVDGGQHANDGDARTRWLAARGYRVILSGTMRYSPIPRAFSPRFLARSARDPPP